MRIKIHIHVCRRCVCLQADKKIYNLQLIILLLAVILFSISPFSAFVIKSVCVLVESVGKERKCFEGEGGGRREVREGEGAEDYNYY